MLVKFSEMIKPKVPDTTQIRKKTNNSKDLLFNLKRIDFAKHIKQAAHKKTKPNRLEVKPKPIGKFTASNILAKITSLITSRTF